jgi:hypothetical protein
MRAHRCEIRDKPEHTLGLPALGIILISLGEPEPGPATKRCRCPLVVREPGCFVMSGFAEHTQEDWIGP